MRIHPRRTRVAAVAMSAVVFACAGCGASSGPSKERKGCGPATTATSDGDAGRHTGGKDRRKKPVQPGAPQADFDGDGHADLAAPSWMGDVDGKGDAGYVTVTYGCEGTAPHARRQLITQDDDALPGETRASASFGDNAVAGDFDDDGHTDLAVTADAEGDGDGHAVIMLWGSSEGLARGTEVDAARSGGGDLQAGDFDGDGHTDLAFSSRTHQGVLAGPFDKQGDPARTRSLPEPDLPDALDDNQPALVAGDIDGDGTTDLQTFYDDAEDDDSADDGGAWESHYYEGGADGLAKPVDTRVPEGLTSQVVADVDKDGHGDLIVPDVIKRKLTVVYGTQDGPGRRTRTIDADTPGVPGKDVADNGQSITTVDAGDVDGDGYADIVAGVNGGAEGAGAVLLVPAGADGPGRDADGIQWIEQPDLDARPKYGDRFGTAVSLTDLDGDHHADLAVGAPGKGPGFSGSGAAWIVPGSDDGLKPDAATALDPTDYGLPDADGTGFGEDFAR